MNKTYFVEGMNVGLRRRLTHQRVRPALVTTAAADVIVGLVDRENFQSRNAPFPCLLKMFFLLY